MSQPITSRSCPYGPMDKAPAYGAGDSGFESQYGLLFFLQKGGDARIELATSCTRSRNHTTRPITHIHTQKRDVLELNQRPIGLQPIALPLSYSPATYFYCPVTQVEPGLSKKKLREDKATTKLMMTHHRHHRITTVKSTGGKPPHCRSEAHLWPSWLRRQTQVLILYEGGGSNPPGCSFLSVSRVIGLVV